MTLMRVKSLKLFTLMVLVCVLFVMVAPACAGTLKEPPKRVLPVVTGSPFVNANFEYGDFRNWAVHEGWEVRDFGKDSDVSGDFSAFSAEGSWVGYFYLNRDINHYPKRLVSKPFTVTKRYLTFYLDGNMGSPNKRVGVDTNGDGKIDIKGPVSGNINGRVAIDLSSAMGKKVSFIAFVGNPKSKNNPYHEIRMAVDELLLEDSPPVVVNLANMTEEDGYIEGDVVLSNAYGMPAEGRLSVVVRDFWGKQVLKRRFNKTVASKGSEHIKFKFSAKGAPQFRIDLTSHASNNQVIQSIHRRHYTNLINEGRPALRLDEDGWMLALSKDRQLELPAKNAEWKKESAYKFNGPAYWRHGSWTKYEAFAQHWYKKEFTLPANFNRGRILIRVHGAFGPLAVFCNGKKAGEGIYKGFARDTYDLTKYMKAGKNTVILRFRNPNIYGRGKDGIQIYPYEKRFKKAMLGIFGNVYIESVPEVWTDYVLIDSSWRKKKLNLRIALKNDSSSKKAVKVLCTVYNPTGKALLRFTPKKVDVKPEGTTIALTQDWPNPVLWTPEHPNLLRLAITVTGPSGKDTYNERFGFAEWYVEGTRYLLNGKQGTHFCGHDYDPNLFSTSRRHHGMNSVRSMGSFDGPYACDELGITFRPIYNAGGGIDRTTPNQADGFLAEQRRQTLGMMYMLYNHPANYLWVIGNERGVYALRVKKVREFYQAMIREMQAIDPTRPATSDGDLDVYGASNLWSVHYPHENKYAEPNRGYFVKDGVNLMDWFPHPPYRGKKPTMFTELFTGGLGGPDSYAPIMGNYAYTARGPFDGYERFFNWRMRAYREQDVACFEPFEPFAYFRNFRPIDLFLKDYSRNVFSGETKQIKVVLLNGGFEDGRFQFVWHLEGSDVQEQTLLLEPGHRALDIPISFPKVAKRTELKFRMWLLKDGKPFARWGRFDTKFKVFPKAKLSEQVACWDLSEKALDMLRGVGLDPVPVNDSAALGKFKLLFTNGLLFGKPVAADVAQWVAKGGRAVILAGEGKAGKLPGGLKLSKFSNTQAHIAAPNHPILKGLGSTDFYHWADGHYVSHQAFLKPIGGAPKVLVENGTTTGLPLASLVEVKAGRGAYLASSLLLAAKAKQEPVVGKLLSNIVAWADEPEPPACKTGMLVTDKLQEFLADSNLMADDLAIAKVAPKDLQDYRLLVVDARVANVDVDVLKQYVEAGGRLMLLRLTPETLGKFKPLLVENLSLKKSDDSPITGAALLTTGPDPLIDGFGNYDLLWKRGHYQRGGPKFHITTLPADYDIVVGGNPKGFKALTTPTVLARTQLGKGEVILSQFRWEEGLASEEKSGRILAALLTNLGCRFQVGESKEMWFFKPIPLAGTCPLDAKRFPGLKDKIKLFDAPSRVLGEVRFQLPTPAGHVVALSSKKNSDIPKSVVLDVNAKASRIAFLQAAAFGYVDYDMGKNVFRYLITLKKGAKRWVEQANVIYARNVYEYLGDDTGTVNDATQVSFSAADGVSSYKMIWKNPSPEATIEKIRIVSLDPKIGAIVFGITLMNEREKATAKERRRSGPFSIGELKEAEQEKAGRRWAVLGAIPVADRFGLNNTAISAEGARDLYDEKFALEKVRTQDLETPVFIRGKRFTWNVFVEPEKVDKRGIYIKYRHVALDEVVDKKYLGKNPNWACYLYTRIYRDIYGSFPKPTAIAFGSDDAAKVWVNGKLVHEFWPKNGGRGSRLGDDLIMTTMHRGWNDVLIKIVNTRQLAAFSFDLREPLPKMKELWKKKGASYLIGLPTLKASYDCLGKRVFGGNARKTFPRVLRFNLRGQFQNTEGSGNRFVERSLKGVFHVNWFKGGYGGVVTSPKQKGYGFADGTFGVMFLVPKGAALSKMWLASRNFGGSNRGDTMIRLLGGKPDKAHGGKDNKSNPYTKLLVEIDPGPKHKDGGKIEIKLGKGLEEDVWHRLSMTWGKGGLVVYLDGKKICSKPKVTSPMFSVWAGISLFSGWQNVKAGEVYFQKAFLTDKILTPAEIKEQFE